MKEEIVKKAAELRIRPVDVSRASKGLVSPSQASNWLKGKISYGAAFAIMLLCEKIEDGYTPPKPERKKRKDKGVPKRIIKAKAEPTPKGIIGTDPYEKRILDLHPATGEWQDWMEWCRWSHGGAEFFGADGEAGFAMRVGDHTHVRINGSIYAISKFNRR